MLDLIKTVPGIIALSLPAFVVVLLVTSISLCRIHPALRGRSMVPTVAVTVVVLFGIPLLIYFHALLNTALLNGAIPVPYEQLQWAALFVLGASAISSAQSALLLIPLYILAYGAARIFAGRRGTQRVVVSWASLVIVIGTGIYVPLRMVYDVSTIREDRRTLLLSDLPERLNGFTIAIMADTQLDAYTDSLRMREYVDRVNRQQPDVVLFAGDLISSTLDVSLVRRAARILAGVRSPHGVYAVPGDHDYYTGRDSVLTALRRNGIGVLADSCMVLQMERASIGIAGLTNIRFDRTDSLRTARVLDAIPPVDVSILLTHFASPDVVEAARGRDINLVAAGHTHGGQISFFLYGWMLSSALFETPYIRGYSAAGNTLVYVANGLGMSVIPIRYNSTPSYGLVILRRR